MLKLARGPGAMPAILSRSHCVQPPPSFGLANSISYYDTGSVQACAAVNETDHHLIMLRVAQYLVRLQVQLPQVVEHRLLLRFVNDLHAVPTE
jgi:hypothetical protein